MDSVRVHIAYVSLFCTLALDTGKRKMVKDIKNKTVVITGGATGIGYEIADSFLKRNSKVIIILDINEKLGGDAVKRLTTKYGNKKAVFYKCDVTTDLEVVYEKIIKNYNTVDVLVNNAGIIQEYSAKKTMDINVVALIEWSFKFLEHMREDKSGKGGTIVNLASIYGYRLDPYLPIYQASKFAVMGFTKSLGHKYNCSRFGVRVVAVCPGFAETNLTSDIKIRIAELSDSFKDFVKGQLWQKPDVVGKAVVDVFEVAESGTAWLIEGAKPISQVL